MITARIRSLFRNFLRRPGVEQSLDEELESCLEILRNEKIAQGIKPAEARRQAQLELGGVAQVTERVRSIRMGASLESMWQDIRYAARGIANRPGFVLIVVFSLAMGIGANTLMFSVIDTVLLRSFPFPNPEELVVMWRTTNRSSDSGLSRKRHYQALQDNGVMDIGAEHSAQFVLGDVPYPETFSGERVTASFLELLRVEPLIGRRFLPEDERPGSNVLMMSERLWRNKFGGNPDVVGSRIRVRSGSNAVNYTVIGVLPAYIQTLFSGPRDIWVPLEFDSEADSRGVLVYGRLKLGVSIETADAALKSLIGALGETEDRHPMTARAERLHQAKTEFYTLQIGILGVAVVFVLLIACASVANLMLAWQAERLKELSIRLAIGAGRSRVFRQLLTESVALALLGGATGTVLAYVSVSMARELIPLSILRRELVGVDGRVLLFTLVASLLASLIIGVIPAWRATRLDIRRPLTGGPGGGRERTWLRSSLIVGEIALALLLVSGAALMIQSFLRLAWKDFGFDRKNLLMTQTALPYDRFRIEEVRVSVEREIQERLLAVPGVQDVSISDFRPLGGTYLPLQFRKENEDAMRHGWKAGVTPGYFSTIGFPLLRGRIFSSRDDLSSTPVAIINEEAARRYWPGEDPIGKRIRLRPGMLMRAKGVRDDEVSREIVGVVGNSVGVSIRRGFEPIIYNPHAQDTYYSGFHIGIRIDPDAAVAGLIPAIRKELAAVDPALSVESVNTMQSSVDADLAQLRFVTTILGIFAVLALLLTIVGVAGVVAYLVRSRTFEFGVRMALGATPANVVMMILSYGIRLAGIGIILGTLGALALSSLLESLLYEVAPRDPRTLLIASVAVVVAVLGSCYIPARRAVRIDPVRALKTE